MAGKETGWGRDWGDEGRRLGQAQGPCRGADGSRSGRGERRASPWLRTCALRTASCEACELRLEKSF